MSLREEWDQLLRDLCKKDVEAGDGSLNATLQKSFRMRQDAIGQYRNQGACMWGGHVCGCLMPCVVVAEQA